ncbi:hypothetical protein AYO21_00585 [Fonsecaea monophora]|uniref:Transcription factor domain-containing protein n=1 Tax=Fonsecaea monophora TaxID=254056 RepID=A0A177FLZ9_9EURO|nr:hypothetical protein AYO21_00585 [Fonsecaea monophora]OAG45237.1 hypothetical protein AYO21_00585 [Fonsecaea monophora]
MSTQHRRHHPTQPAADKFLFVNYDSSSSGGSHDHSQVLSHVRQNYHVWRRKQSVKHLRDLIVVHRTYKEKLPLPSVKRHNVTDRPDRIVSVTPKKADPTRRAGGASGGTRLCSSMQLHMGNSDPFHAYPVKISPQVNELIAFYRDYLLPAQYHVPAAAWVSSANARLDWSICVSTLQEPALAHAFIARSATVAAVLNPAMRTLAMRYRLRSIQELRLRLLNDANHTFTDVNVLQIIMLQKADIVEQNLSAAMAHAKILQNMFQEQQRRKHTVNFTLLQYALWSDTQISSIFMTPLAFDVSPDGWIEKTMQPLWTAALEQLQELPQWTAAQEDAATLLDPSVEGEELKAFFISRRTTLQTWLLYGLNGLPTPPLIMLWLTTTACLQQGRMIKHYIRAIHEVIHRTSLSPVRAESEDGSAEQIEYWYTQQYLILAEFLWTHHSSYKVEVCGINLFDMVPTQLKNLRAALQHAENSGWSSTPGGLSKYRNARLWALFIGAHAELLKSTQEMRSSATSSNKILHKSRHGKEVTPAFAKCSRNVNYCDPGSHGDVYDRWFEIELAHQVRDMGLSAWEEVYLILRRFNYADVIQPFGEEVYCNAMKIF